MLLPEYGGMRGLVKSWVMKNLVTLQALDAYRLKGYT